MTILRTITKNTHLFITAFVAVFLLTACGSSSIQTAEPISVENDDPSKPSAWFCEAAADDSGWQCLQDESLVKYPQPTRIPQAISKQPPNPQISSTADNLCDDFTSLKD